MSASDIIKAVVWEDSAPTLLARIKKADGNYVTQAALTSITCKVYDLQGTTPDTATATPTVTIASSIFDTLQTGGMWTADSTGYNFSHTQESTIFANGDHTYLVEYLFTPTSGGAWWVVFEVYVRAVKTS